MFVALPKSLIVCNPLSGLAFNAPSDGDGDLPLVTLQFLRDFLGILTGLPQVCWIVTCHVPLLIGDLSMEVSSMLQLGLLKGCNVAWFTV